MMREKSSIWSQSLISKQTPCSPQHPREYENVKKKTLEWSKTIKSKESEEENTKANKQWTWISQIQWHRSLEFHLSDRFLNQSRYRTQYALNISPWCQLGIREKEDGCPSVFPCYFRESSVVHTTQRDTKGLHAKEDPDKEIGYLNQTQTWRHVFRHSPTLTSQSSCYHPREERDHKTSKKASTPGTSSRRKRLGLQGNARLTHLWPSFARTWLRLPITVPSKIFPFMNFSLLWPQETWKYNVCQEIQAMG